MPPFLNWYFFSPCSLYCRAHFLHHIMFIFYCFFFFLTYSFISLFVMLNTLRKVTQGHIHFPSMTHSSVQLLSTFPGDHTLRSNSGVLGEYVIQFFLLWKPVIEFPSQVNLGLRWAYLILWIRKKSCLKIPVRGKVYPELCTCLIYVTTGINTHLLWIHCRVCENAHMPTHTQAPSHNNTDTHTVGLHVLQVLLLRQLCWVTTKCQPNVQQIIHTVTGSITGALSFYLH